MATILVADDDPITCYAIQRILGECGHEVRALQSSIAAWDAARQHTDVLITNVSFSPGEPHGVALANHARASNSGLRVIFMTALRHYASELRAADEIAILKPCAFEELV